MRQNGEQEMMDEDGGRYGDPRHCPRHRSVVTSSPDGMFDTPCSVCEEEQNWADLLEAIPSRITDPEPEPGTDPLYGLRMDSADCGEN